MDEGMDQKQFDEDELVAKISDMLKNYNRTPRFLRTHFDEIEQEFEEG